MVSDNLINVIAGLVKREGRIAREDAKKAKDALKAEAEKDDEEEDDEDEDPVGDPTPAGKDTATEPEKKPEPAAAGGEGEPDNKPTGPDPALVAQIAAIIKKEIKDDEKKKKEKEVKLSGKKEKIDTTPTMKQEGKMNFREAVRKSITGSPLAEGYESHVLEILNDESIDGPLGYEPFFENGKLYVMKGQEGKAKKALKNSKEVSKLPKIIGEELSEEEYLAMESVAVDGRLKGFKEALKRLTYEKLQKMKEKVDAKKKVEVDEKIMTDEESELQKKYKEFYDKMIAKYGVKSPAELDDDKKKEFFNALEKGWKEGEGPVKEEIEEAHIPVSVDGRRKGFKEALTRLTYEKLRKLHDQAKSEEIRRSEERWSSESVEEMSGKKKIEIEEAKGIGNFNTDPKKIKKEYEDNEDINHHTENYLLLAVHFGTNTQVKKVKEIMKRNEKQGSTSQKDNDWMYKNIMPYYDKIRNEEVELGETVELQIVMALDDVDIVATEITDKEVTVKKKEVKKAEAALKKSFKGKKVPKVVGEGIESTYNRVKGLWSKLNESFDREAAVELKLSIENDADLYRQQIVPIVKNIQRKMKKGTYDHLKAPKLWMYLVDNGAKKYVKAYGGDVKTMFPKDLRKSVAVEFANEYKAEIEIQGGDML